MSPSYHLALDDQFNMILGRVMHGAAGKGWASDCHCYPDHVVTTPVVVSSPTYAVPAPIYVTAPANVVPQTQTYVPATTYVNASPVVAVPQGQPVYVSAQVSKMSRF